MINVNTLPGGKYEICYEFGFKLFEDLSIYSSQLSSIANLHPGKIIGLTIAVDDVDSNPLEKDVQLRTYSGNGYKHQAEEVSNVLLDAPTAPDTLYDELLLLSDN